MGEGTRDRGEAGHLSDCAKGRVRDGANMYIRQERASRSSTGKRLSGTKEETCTNGTSNLFAVYYQLVATYCQGLTAIL